MRKIFLKLYPTGYSIVEQSQTLNFDLLLLWESFYNQDDWIEIDEEDGWVTIWNTSEIKRKKKKQFVSLEEQKKYDVEYRAYWLKCWEEIPKLKITQKNYQEVLQLWNENRKEKKAFIIISIDDSGWVFLEAKDVLLEQDLQDLEKEHQIYLNFKQKYDDYKPFLKGKNYEWESPNDDEYYSDFLTEDEIVWKKKKF